jgi:uncharacterized RDD family membrane protein YckC
VVLGVTTEIPEGWYADPQGSGPHQQRWWNGHQWTAHTRQVDLPPPPPPGPSSGPAHDVGPGPGGTPPPDLVAQFRSLPRALPDGTPVPTPAERTVAYAVDVGLVWVAANLVGAVVGIAFGLGDRWLLPLGLPWFLFTGWLDGVVLAVLWLGYQLAFRGSGGTTFGKKLLHLRVRPAGAEGPLSTGQVLRRAAVGGGGVLFLMFPGAQLLGLALLGYDAFRMTRDPLGRPWHDEVAGTAVVKAPPD